MMEQIEVDRIPGKAAPMALRGIDFSKVYSAPTSDLDERDALHVVIVVKDDQIGKVTGDNAINSIVLIENCGEARFPFVDFVQENEMDVDGDP